MEAAIRWSPGLNDDQHRFLLVDVAGGQITLNEGQNRPGRTLESNLVARYDKVPNFTAFDWSRVDPSLLALGLSSGDASLVKIDTQKGSTIAPLRVFPIRTQRKCNSITFNSDRLLAVGLDRVRNDHCLTVYDVNEGKEPHSRLCTGEAVSSVRFFPTQPQELVAAVARSTLRICDLRDSSMGTGFASTVFTKQVNNIAIDPLDDNYFVSGGSTGDPTVSVWDKRWLPQPNPSASANDMGTTPVFELRPAVDNSYTTTVWSIRFSGIKRGRFAIMSSTGELKLCDMATHSMQSKGRTGPANFYGGNPWTLPHYISKTHHLQYPHHDRRRGRDETARVIAFDWTTSSAGAQSILTLSANRGVGFLNAPTSSAIEMTPRDDLAVHRHDAFVIEPAQYGGTVADDTRQSQDKMQPQKDDIGSDDQLKLPDRSILLTKRFGTVSSISAQRTEKWLEGDADRQITTLLRGHDVADALALINIHRRRCFEGYRLDPKRNREIVKDDPALVKLWQIIARLETLAKGDRMCTNTFDLSFIGVYGIWHGSLEKNTRNRLLSSKPASASSFDAAVRDLVVLHHLSKLDKMPAATAHKRLLSLEICGWCFSRDGIEGKCYDLLEQRQHYRAVAVAYFQGHPDLSLVILRNITRNKIIPDTGVGVLLASDSLNEEQKSMCSWMEEDAEDPYLKSLLRYLAGRDWREVAHDTTLNLSDRLSVALRYMSDDDTTAFIESTSEKCIAEADISGILLTGLTDTSMNLFQAYINRTNDLQTAVLATSFTNPLYVNDIRFEMWKETYLHYMQTWRAFIPRTKYTAEHSRLAISRTGEKLIKPASRQITLRCAHCNGSLAKQQAPEKGIGHKSTLSMSFADSPTPSKGQLANQAQRAAEAAGTVCPRCGRHLPRCAICMQWLVSPTPSKSKASGSSGKQVDRSRDTGPVNQENEILARFVTFCASCGHGFHAQHARLWFAKHGMCPVPDCECLCGIRR